MTQLHFRIGTSLLAASALSLMGLTLVSAQGWGMNEAKGTTGEQVKICLQQWQKNGFEGGNLSRTKRMALRMQYRACVHRAAMQARSSGRPSIVILSPNGGETYKNDGSSITVNWETKNVPSSHIIDVIRLRAYPNGQEYNLAYNVINDGHEIVVPTSVPSGSYTLEMKTYVNGILVTDGSDSYFKIVDIAAATSDVSEQIKCVFNGSTTKQTCYHSPSPDDSLYSFSCSGIETCVVDVKGPQGTSLTWKSSCGGYAYTTLDGTSEYAKFSCGDTGQPSITLLSPNGGETLTPGKTYRVGWATANIPGGDVRVRVDLYPVHSDTGLPGDETGLVGFADADEQSITWTVPQSLTAGAYTMTIVVADFNVHSEGLIIAKDSSDSYFKIVDSISPVSEQIKCVFNGSTTKQTCYSSNSVDNPFTFTFSGIETAGGEISGPKGTVLTWKSSCGGYAYTTFDGVSEYAHFYCQ